MVLPYLSMCLCWQANQKGQLVSTSNVAGTAARPFDKDGARAVDVLTRQVRPLMRQI